MLWLLLFSQARRALVALTGSCCVHAMAFDDDFDWDAAIADEQRHEADAAEEAARQEFERMEALEPEPSAGSAGTPSSSSSPPRKNVTSPSPSTSVETPPKRPVQETVTSLSPSTSVETPPAEPSRKRLRKKTSVFQARPAILPIQKTLGVWDKFMAAAYPSAKNRYQAIWYKLKWWLAREETEKQVVPALLPAAVLKRSRLGFRTLLPEEKPVVIRAFLDNTNAPEAVRSIMDSCSPSGAGKNEKLPRIYAKTVLVTYNGDWGKMPEDFVKAGTDQDGILAQLQRDGRLNVLWCSFRGFAEEIMRDYKATAWAASMELCVDTLETGQGIRVHLHLGLKSDVRKMHIMLNALEFRGSLPHVRGHLPGVQVRASGGWAQIYYCMAPKIGVVYQDGNHQPFKHFPIQGQWPFTMLQAGKMEKKACREQIIKSGRGIVRLLSDFDKYVQSMEELKVEARMEEYAAELAKTQLTSVTEPRIEEWKKAATKPFQRRKQFLVLEGPSGLGKTEYVKALFGHDKVLELNCGSCGNVVSLRQFRAGQHQCVLFDEASARLVLHNRKVFQAPPGWVDLGHSPTGRDIYRVFLGDTVLVVNSNKWSEELAKIEQESPSDHAWLVKNACLVQVTANLYLA